MIYGNEACYSCGMPADADWTICSSCKLQEMQEITSEEGFIDEHGKFWTYDEYQKLNNPVA